jgi:hypothetical protein
MHSGNATRKTTTEARRSWEKVLDESDTVEVCDIEPSIECQRARG